MIWEAGFCLNKVFLGPAQSTYKKNQPPNRTLVWPLFLPRIGADVTLQADQGETVLHLAAQHGKAELVTLLLGCLAKKPLDGWVFQFFFVCVGGWFNRKGFPVCFVKRRNNIKFLLPKIQYRFHLGHFFEAPKRMDQKGPLFVWLKVWNWFKGFFCLLVDKWIFSKWYASWCEKVFKMIQDASFSHPFVQLWSYRWSFLNFEGCAIIATSSQRRS